MALLSRSSLRSVRQTPDHSDDGLPPKKLRAQENGSHRRRSSPDCLDTSVLQSHDSDQARLANPPLKSTRPRTSTRRTRQSSSESVDSVAPTPQLIKPTTPRAIGNGTVDDSRGRSVQGTPSGVTSADYLLDDRESPDPLDTISPAVNSPTKAPSEVASADKIEHRSTNTPVATRATRRSDPKPKTDTTDVANEEIKSAERSASTRSDDATRSVRTRQTDPVQTEHSTPTQQGSERRSLRSADTGSRCKSELAPYFHNYEQLISLESPKPESLAASTAIVLVDNLPEQLLPSPDPSPFGNPLKRLHNCEVISLPDPVLRSAAVDPLNDELYFRVHRRFERQEKQLRNIERERAQHEKQNVDRLLEELRSQDWLRIMGLTGVHESEKKLYEPKRQILIQELAAVLNKFQVWKDEEKRRKLAKDKPHPAVDTEVEPGRPQKRPRPAEDVGDGDGSPVSGVDTPSTPDPNDVDAWAARQLHQEARSASAAKPRKSIPGTHKARAEQDDSSRSKETQSASKRQKIQQSPHVAPAVFYYEPYPPKPFTSFFDDRQARDAAIAATTGPRPSPRSNVLAFGHPIPEMDEREFEPPPELLTEEYIQASRRQRRRLNRRSQG